MARKQRKPEVLKGGYYAVPHAVFDSTAYSGATLNSRAFIYALIRQLNGSNNGHLQLTDRWLSKNGHKNSSTNRRCTKELIERGLIVQTRWGGLNNGCNWYAVTWLPISNFVGLHIDEQDYQQGAWARINLPPTPRIKNNNLQAKEKKQPPHIRCCTTPIYDAGDSLAAPIYDAEKVLLDHSTTPIYDDNVFNTNTHIKESLVSDDSVKKPLTKKPIVGKAKSMRKAT